MGSSSRQEPRLGGQCPGHGHPLGLAAGELTGPRTGPVGQLHPIEPFQARRLASDLRRTRLRRPKATLASVVRWGNSR